MPSLIAIQNGNTIAKCHVHKLYDDFAVYFSYKQITFITCRHKSTEYAVKTCLEKLELPILENGSLKEIMQYAFPDAIITCK